MISGKFLMGRGRDQLSLEEQIMIEEGIADVRMVPAGKLLIQGGQLVDSSTLLLEGFVGRYVRQRMVGMHVPGDFVDLHGFQLKYLDYDVVTLGAVKIATYDHKTLARLSERYPRLTQILWISSLLDGSINREWIFRLGRLGAQAQIAHFVCELYTRLEMVGLVKDNCFALPMTQPDLGAATGLTAVHVNRTLSELRQSGLLHFKNHQVRILDREALSRLGDFEPQFLYGPKFHK